MKTKHTIESTSDYSQFVKHENQQPQDDAHVRKLAESMKKYGFLPSKPAQVFKHGSKLMLIDGHHRVAAAQLASVPVLYVIEPESHKDLIADGNWLVRKWKTESFVDRCAAHPMSAATVHSVAVSVGVNVI